MIRRHGGVETLGSGGPSAVEDHQAPTVLGHPLGQFQILLDRRQAVTVLGGTKGYC